MGLSYTDAALALFLAWLVSHAYRFYRLYKLLPEGPTCFSIFHFYRHPLGLLPPVGDYSRSFVLTLGPQHWSRTIMHACVGPERVNKQYDYLNMMSLFPLSAETSFYDAEALRQMHADRSRFERPRGVRDIVAVYGENVSLQTAVLNYIYSHIGPYDGWERAQAPSHNRAALLL